jgi:hypothetical protein
MKATSRCNTWPQAESATAKAARHKRHTRAHHKAARERLAKERRMMCAEEKHSRLLNNGVRRTRVVQGTLGWRQVDKRRALRRLGEAWAARWAAERKQSRLKLEARAAAEREARRAGRNGVGTGAGRRTEGPAEMELRALLRRETAVPKTKAVPKRLAPRGEVRDGLAGTWTWWDSRAPNELGLVQSFLPDDEVAETVERAAAEEGCSSGEEMAGSAAASEDRACSHWEAQGADDRVDGRGASACDAYDSALDSVGDGGACENVLVAWEEEGEDAWAGGDSGAATEVAEHRVAHDGCGDDALLEDALERARQTALEMGERDVWEW